MANIQKTTIKRFNGTDWDEIHLSTSGDIVRIGDDISIIGNDLGAYKVGDIIQSSDSIQSIIKKISQSRIPPIYTGPLIKLSILNGTDAGSYEVGTNISSTIQSLFIKNDAGNISEHSISINGTEVLSGSDNPAKYSYDHILGDETINFSSKVLYGEGLIKSDNLDELYPTGHIKADSITESSILYTGIRKGFYGSDTLGIQDSMSTSDEIRSLITIPGIIEKGKIITALMPSGSTRFTISYKSDIGEISEILYKVCGNINITKQFNLTKVYVEGLNKFTPVEYNVYTFSLAQPIIDTITFTIKI